MADILCGEVGGGAFLIFREIGGGEAEFFRLFEALIMMGGGANLA